MTKYYAVAAILLASFTGVTVIAQEAPPTPTIPFLPPGFGSNPEKMLEHMFGASTPQEEKVLAGIEISFKDEREYGQQLVAAYLADLRRQKLRVVQKDPTSTIFENSSRRSTH